MMPTGYTADVADGKITELAPFLTRLARGMGFLIMMRDEPWDAPIPEKFEPSDHHANKLVEARTDLNNLLRMLPDEAEEAAAAHYDTERARFRKRVTEQAETRARYDKLIAELEAWAPMHEAMIGLRRFGLEQLRESVRFDCYDLSKGEPQRLSGEEWRTKQEAHARWEIDYHTKELAAEERRAADRTECVVEFRRELAALSGASK